MSVSFHPALRHPAAFASRAATRVGTLAVKWVVSGLLGLAGLLLALPLQAHGDDDHERARAALRAGEVLPLATLLERLQRSHPGRVLEVELERDDGRWIYEVKLLQADGQLLKLELDARSGELLSQRRKGKRGGHPPGGTRP
jgi:uncharacterized membrane protein YkoI